MSELMANPIAPCADQEENLVLLHYGDLGEPEARNLRVHVHACAGCAAYLSDLGVLLPMALGAADPSPAFWNDYDRELRRKIDTVAGAKTWAQKLSDFFQPRWVPAFAMAAVVALALTFTIDRGTWMDREQSQNDSAILEVMPMAENLEFFNAMEVLDNLDVLESMGAQGNAA